MTVTRRSAVALLLFAGFAVAQRPAPTAPPAPALQAPTAIAGPWANKFFLPNIEKTPGILAPPIVDHDFGTVPGGTLCKKTYSITNIYDVPIQVIDVRVECGCLAAQPPQRVLQPNETAEFGVTMNSAVFTGKTSKKMYVTFGPHYVSTAELRFTADSSRELMLGAPGQIDFGFVPEGTKATKTLTLQYRGQKGDWDISADKATNPAYEIELRATSKGPVLGYHYALTANLKADAKAGEISDTITLRTNDPANPLVTVNVRGIVQPPLAANPKSVDFGDVKIGETKQYKVLVTSAAPTRLGGLSDTAHGLVAATSSGESTKQIVNVTFTPTKAGPFQQEVTLVSSLPGNPKVVLTIEANVVK